jgi:hypothetical protein
VLVRQKGMLCLTRNSYLSGYIYRDDEGNPITITVEQVRAIWRALDVVEEVRRHEHDESLWANPSPNVRKRRLLGRILVDGRPPTRCRPPSVLSGPNWSALRGGDPFSGTAKDAR